MKNHRTSIAEKTLSIITLLILGLVPFHALLTTWAGSNFGHLDVWRIWKELLLTAVFPAAAVLAYKTPVFWRWFTRSWLSRLILAYLLLHLVYGLYALNIDQVNGPALLYGWFANVRYLVLFLFVALASYRLPFYRPLAIRVMGLGVGVVVVFGLLQLTVLPTYFLEHFGYGKDTIPAVQTVDNKESYQRIQSTLRGANPLGAYLLVAISVLGAYVLTHVRAQKRVFLLALLALVCLWFTYSRSALLGVLVAGALLLFWGLPTQYRKLLAVGCAGLLVVMVALLIALRNNDVVQNSVFHSDEHSTSVTSSNFDRLGALQRGSKDVLRHPLGEGPGTAGPASTRNDRPARIAENYYIQIGQEVGWLGLAMLIAMSAIVAKDLWRVKRDWLAAGLLASFIGLFVVNMLSHAWADDTLGLLWWGLAGVLYGSAIIGGRKQQTKNASS